MKKLKVVSSYDNNARNLHFHAGDEIEVDERVAEYLLHDSPGSFADPAETEEQRAERLSGDVKPYDLPPDGTTLKVDPLPPVVTGPDSGVDVVSRATPEESAELEEQARKEREEADAKRAEEQRAKDEQAPAKRKDVREPERRK